jgi:hypothetical protein
LKGLRLDADVARLFVAQLGELHADLVDVQARDLLVEMLGQRVDFFRQRLVGEPVSAAFLSLLPRA